MRIESLGFIDKSLSDVGIDYEFSRWTREDIPDTYWIGSFTDSPSLEEDGISETSFILTGTTHNSWLDLMNQKEIIENLFPSVGGLLFSDESYPLKTAVYYDNSFPVPTDTMDIKRIQINLKIIEMKGK